MTIRVALHHKTTYRYDRTIAIGPQLIRLRPAYHARTPIEAYDLRVDPADHFRNWQQDPFGNPIARFVFPEKHDHLSIEVNLIADMTVINPFDFFIEESADQFPFDYDEALRKQLAPYLVAGEGSPPLDRWVDAMPKSADRMVDFLVAVNQKCQNQIDYLVRMEPGVQSPEETLELGSGSCRDSAWLMVQTFRHLGIAARFVSGYLIQLAADQDSLDGPSGPTEDFCDLHAWTEVYLPGAGWIGLDPTSGLFAGEGHIPLACTPSYTGAAPITGGHEACEVEFSHEMSVSRHHEDPRVTLPYRDDQWDAIMAAGHAVDERLDSQDVRLTMGGEPTFVSIDAMDDPQWNTDAVGPEKRILSNQLLLRLRDRFGAGSFLHYGQGKWYPGESLPRWALTCVWRRDGQAIWLDDQWIADESKDYGHGDEDAKTFIRRLANRLGISVKQTFPVFEDTFHYLWRENQLPLDVSPTDPKLEDPNERSMMIRTFRRGLSRPTGHVMPLRRAWWQAQPGWIGGRWPIRGEYVYLLPGDSPIGLRLPLESLPTQSVSTGLEYATALDPSVSRPAFPTAETKGRDQEPLRDHYDETKTQGGESINPQTLDDEDDDELPTSDDVVRTALCVEARHGRIYVFMPPTQRAEDYLDLVQAIEQTCGETGLPVIIEGYLPPTDDRLELFKVTPDPGVIEVNTQPSKSWDELVGLTETLYEEARQCRLGTEKFDLDGRHTGTGGGNHIVMGGRQVSDSPFLRRPDLLGSMIAFWNNHPSLSYLFSGKFIGPTSQAPRFDESRRDAVYEMEIALSQLPDRSQVVQPWTVDRLFRDLLVDLTGNTHRAEICVDKLYSPDSATGRLGLVELRGFEMPPHERMSLAQSLLIRSIVSAFWDEPYREPLVDWGTSLHDRFMLPHFVWDDFCRVTEDLATRGISLDPAWYTPHHEFRFSKIGEVNYQGVSLKLRQAMEPWYVMGEEPGGGGTTRFVDSSLERIEIEADGYDERRHQILCNSIPVPMTSTATQMKSVAGIRFRAWQPPRCLHPTIGIHSPLTIEIMDLANQQSIGGCTYHVVHPGGRGTDRFPVNANEAESRRAARFETLGLSGDLPPSNQTTLDAARRTPLRSGAYPVTLDLRRL